MSNSIPPRNFRLVVMGASTGGVQALKIVLGGLPADFPLPVLVVQHLAPGSGDGLARLLDETCSISVKEADEEEPVLPGCVYLAPPGYHMLVEQNGAISLAWDRPVNYARPSADVLFESAAIAFGPEVVAVVLTGAGSDGSRGAKLIRERGGLLIVQDPAGAEAPSMPRQALCEAGADHLVPVAEIAALLLNIAGKIA